MNERPERYFDSVQEAYIDLLLLEEFWSSNTFREWWLAKVDFPDSAGHDLIDARHSVSGAEGESDLVLEVADRSGTRWAVLIEDKVDAAAQPDQAIRYRVRGGRGFEEGQWDRFVTCIVARQSYLEASPDSRRYDRWVTLESVREFFAASQMDAPRRAYKLAVLDAAIDPTYPGYVKEPDEGVSGFLRRYGAVSDEFPDLRITSPLVGGSRSLWVYFDTGVRGVTLIHKVTKGFVDLQVPAEVAGRADLEALQSSLGDATVELATTGKSTSLRVLVPAIDKSALPNGDDSIIRAGLEAARRLRPLSNRIARG